MLPQQGVALRQGMWLRFLSLRWRVEKGAGDDRGSSCVGGAHVESCSKASTRSASLAKIKASSAKAAFGFVHMRRMVSEPAATRTTHSSHVSDTG